VEEARSRGFSVGVIKDLFCCCSFLSGWRWCLWVIRILSVLNY